MVRLAAAAALLAACGRLDFDAVPPVPIGHDEDGDGIADSEDPCPHIAGDRADADGDGVGDACDPNPNTPTESWISFSTMQPGDQPLDDPTGFDQQPDSLHIAGTVMPKITRTLGTVRFDIGVDIHGIVGDPMIQHQIAAGIDNSAADAYYFGELNFNFGVGDVSVDSYDNTNGYKLLDPKSLPGIHSGAATFRLDAIAGINAQHVLVTGWPGELYTSMAATPAFSGGTDLRMAINNLDLDIRYIALIGTSP